jgi:hypothetical protein
MKFTYVMGTSFTYLRLSFHKVSVVINSLFPPLRDTLYAGRVKHFDEALRACRQYPFHHSKNDGPSV